MRAKDAVGRYGEDVAVRHLEDAGFTILARNWRCPEGELDVVAVDGGVLVFVEVKTRSSVAFGIPAEAVTRRKADQLRRLALVWLQAQQQHWPDIRFDVVSVLRRDRGAAEVEHLAAVL